jgi:hypothetical protein
MKRHLLIALNLAAVLLVTSVLSSKPAQAAPPTMPGKWLPPALTGAQLATRPWQLRRWSAATPTHPNPPTNPSSPSWATAISPVRDRSSPIHSRRTSGDVMAMAAIPALATPEKSHPAIPDTQIVYDSCIRGSIYGYHTEAIAKWYDGVSWHTSDVNSISVFLTCG